MSILIAALMLVSPEMLCERASAIDKAEEALRNRYTYREVAVTKDFDKKGNVERTRSETFDCFFLEGAIYRKLVMQNERPLDPKKQAEVDAALARERDKRRKEHKGVMNFERSIQLVEVGEAPKYYDLTSTENTLDGRKVWIVAGKPKAKMPDTKESKDAAGVQPTFWIDQENGAVLKRESLILKKTNSFEPGSIIRWHYMRVNDEVWQNDRFEMKVNLSLFKMVHARLETESIFSDYKKFDVESSITYK